MGGSVATAGDINGDGIDDMIVGAPYGDDGGNDAGEAYVVYGKASGFGTADGTGRTVIDLGNDNLSFTAGDGFIIRGDDQLDGTGWSVSSAGDVNGDGFDDLIVGAPTPMTIAAFSAQPMSCSGRPPASARLTAAAVRSSILSTFIGARGFAAGRPGRQDRA